VGVGRDAIGNPANVIFVSAATAWEITTKHRLGKLPGAAAIAPDIAGCLAEEGFDGLAITLSRCRRGRTAARPPAAIPLTACSSLRLSAAT
jgi:PIN domain nuclease of toxin-antitoxin system